MKLGTFVRLREEVRCDLRSGGCLVVSVGAVGMIVGWLPSHPLGPTGRVRIQVSDFCYVEVLIGERDLEAVGV